MTEIIVQVVLFIVMLIVAVIIGHMFYLGVWRQAITYGTFVCYRNSSSKMQVCSKEGRFTWVTRNKDTGESNKTSAEMCYPVTTYWSYWKLIL